MRNAAHDVNIFSNNPLLEDLHGFQIVDPDADSEHEEDECPWHMDVETYKQEGFEDDRFKYRTNYVHDWRRGYVEQRDTLDDDGVTCGLHS